MIRQCFLTRTGIQFYRKTFKDIGLDSTTLFPKVKPLEDTGSEALGPSASNVAEARASTHCPDTRNHSADLDDQVQASPMAACTFKSEQIEELLDALSPICDQLDEPKAWYWWILEILPLHYLEQDREDFLWVSYRAYVFFSSNFPPFLTQAHARVIFLLRANLGYGRKIPKPVCKRNEKVLVHRSVKTRMDAASDCLEGGKYKPKANFEQYEFEWVN
jgi:hypothetical protein